MPDPSIDHIPIQSKCKVAVCPLPLKDFFAEIRKKNPIVGIANDHYPETIQLIASNLENIPAPMFIEVTKSEQESINNLVADAKIDGENKELGSVLMGREESFGALFKAAKKLTLNNHNFPLVCMDVDFKGEREGDLGVGNQKQQEAAKKKYEEKNGVGSAKPIEEKLYKQRDVDTLGWVNHMTDYVAKHKIEEFSFTGGRGHFEWANAANKILAEKLGKKVVRVDIYSHQMVMEPVIIKGEGFIKNKSANNPDFQIIQSAPDEFHLTPEEFKRIREQYEPLFKHPDAVFKYIEFAKWKHAGVVQNLNEMVSISESLASGEHDDLKEYERTKTPVSTADKDHLKQTAKSFVEARKSMDATPPDYETARSSIFVAKSAIDTKFLGGIKALAAKMRRNDTDELYMAMSYLSEQCGKINDGITATESRAKEKFSDLGIKRASLSAPLFNPQSKDSGVELPLR